MNEWQIYCLWIMNLKNDEIVTLLYETGTPFKNGKLINPEGFINALSKNN